MNKLRLGVIGYGNMGRSHVEKIMNGKVPTMEVSAVCDCSPARLDALNAVYPQIPVFDNATDMFKSGLCDVVIIATPHRGVLLRTSCHH